VAEAPFSPTFLPFYPSLLGSVFEVGVASFDNCQGHEGHDGDGEQDDN
jgi:hypothetical protein